MPPDLAAKWFQAEFDTTMQGRAIGVGGGKRRWISGIGNDQVFVVNPGLIEGQIPFQALGLSARTDFHGAGCLQISFGLEINVGKIGHFGGSALRLTLP